MENQTEKVEIKPKNMYISICITQAICIAVILIAILIIKFFFAANLDRLHTVNGFFDLVSFKFGVFSDDLANPEFIVNNKYFAHFGSPLFW